MAIADVVLPAIAIVLCREQSRLERSTPSTGGDRGSGWTPHGREGVTLKHRITLLVVALAALTMLGLTATSAEATVVKPRPVVYNSIPKNLPGNVPSQAFQATQTSEFGDAVSFGPGTTDHLKQVTVVMSSWACQSGHWSDGTCVTTPGATFAVPITLKLYTPAPGDPTTPGAVFASSTKVFHIQYRPSADPVSCPTNPTGWKAPDGHCYNGKARRISFYFKDGLALPSQLIYGVSFDTSGFGLHPHGYNQPCNSTVQGCAYDSLNMAAAASAPNLGTDLFLDRTFLDSDTAGQYCDGGAGGTGTFRLDDGCGTGSNPLVRFKVFLS